MKKIILAVLFIMLSSGIVLSDEITLNSTETIDTPTAAKIYWYIDYLNVSNHTLQIKYRWVDANGRAIKPANAKDPFITWTCNDRVNQNASCTDVGVPDPWCTGLGEGTGDPGSTCFTDVFLFNIRAQDVGTPIGIGLRTLIWNHIKDDILTPGNDGTFTE